MFIFIFLDPPLLKKRFIRAIFALCPSVKFVIRNALFDPIPNKSNFTFHMIVQIAPKNALAIVLTIIWEPDETTTYDQNNRGDR